MSEPVITPDQETEEQIAVESLYRVVLFDDQDHSYEYVCQMMMSLLGKTLEQAFEIAYEVDHLGEVVVATLPLEKAQAVCTAIRTYGPDPLIERSATSMQAAVLEAE